jgi:SAM-dependent methyltransferase
MKDRSFEQLVAEAERQPFTGWDFSFIRDRWHEDATSWDYAALIRRYLASVARVLDLGTGGGEFLASLAPLPADTVATEAYPPNVEVARRHLAPLGVRVVAVTAAPDNTAIGPGEGIGTLPFSNAHFPLVLSRHESYYPADVFRILQPGGAFITQQVGDAHNADLNRLLGAPGGFDPRWTLAFASRQLEEAGFRIVEQREEFADTVFHDIGALVYYLKAVPWQIPSFTVDAYRDQLLAIHERMETEDGLRVRGHLFYIEALRP